MYRKLYNQLISLTETEKRFKHNHENNVKVEDNTTLPHTETEITYFSVSNSTPALNVSLMKHACYSLSLPHSHDYFEAVYVLNGSIKHTIAGETVSMSTGDLCFVPPGTTHCIDSRNSSSIINILIRRTFYEHIESSFLEDTNILSAFFTNNMYVSNVNDYICFHTGNDLKLQNMILNMYDEIQTKNKFYETILDYHMNILMRYLLRHYEDACEFPKITKRTDSQIFGILQYISSNYTTISLKSLAEKFHFTPEYASKFIHANTGKTFSALVTDTRIDQAKKLLLNSQLSIAEISHTVGYKSPENFIRVFKKRYNQTPTKYRQQ